MMRGFETWYWRSAMTRRDIETSTTGSPINSPALVARSARKDHRPRDHGLTSELHRLWRDEGKAKEADELLAPGRGWFAEGRDTADLSEAGALVEELEAAA